MTGFVVLAKQPLAHQSTRANSSISKVVSLKVNNTLRRWPCDFVLDAFWNKVKKGLWNAEKGSTRDWPSSVTRRRAYWRIRPNVHFFLWKDIARVQDLSKPKLLSVRTECFRIDGTTKTCRKARRAQLRRVKPWRVGRRYAVWAKFEKCWE